MIFLLLANAQKLVSGVWKNAIAEKFTRTIASPASPTFAPDGIRTHNLTFAKSQSSPLQFEFSVWLKNSVYKNYSATGEVNKWITFINDNAFHQKNSTWSESNFTRCQNRTQDDSVESANATSVLWRHHFKTYRPKIELIDVSFRETWLLLTSLRARLDLPFAKMWIILN